MTRERPPIPERDVPIFKPRSFHDLMQMDFTVPRDKPIRWGGWILKERALVLYHESYPSYHIDLERITTSYEVHDWIFHINGKDIWDDLNKGKGGKKVVMADLVNALCDLYWHQQFPIKDIKKYLRGRIAKRDFGLAGLDKPYWKK